jgi:hypothetical protein
MRSTDKVESLIEIFRRACRPPTPIERLHAYLEAALDCASDTTKTEEIRIAEVTQRVATISDYINETRHPEATAI